MDEKDLKVTTTKTVHGAYRSHPERFASRNDCSQDNKSSFDCVLGPHGSFLDFYRALLRFRK
jgi:hypothetical protein